MGTPDVLSLSHLLVMLLAVVIIDSSVSSEFSVGIGLVACLGSIQMTVLSKGNATLNNEPVCLIYISSKKARDIDIAKNNPSSLIETLGYCFESSDGSLCATFNRPPTSLRLQHI